jgi:MFS family permease
LSLITNIFTDPVRRAKAIGLWSATVGVAAGPMTGGWLLEHFSWGLDLLDQRARSPHWQSSGGSCFYPPRAIPPPRGLTFLD